MDDRLKPAAIYIQGLPTSIGNIQVEDICKKAGKIKKIKVYRDAGGVPKGDALVVFEAKRDRDVAADAVAMLDDMDVDQGGLGCYTISVSEAQFSQPRRAPKPKEEAPRSQRELAAAAAKAWGKELPPTDVVQAGDYSAPADCPKALVSNVFDATKTTERDASIETEFGRECQRFGRVLDAECARARPGRGRVAHLVHGRRRRAQVLRRHARPHLRRPRPALRALAHGRAARAARPVAVALRLLAARRPVAVARARGRGRLGAAAAELRGRGRAPRSPSRSSPTSTASRRRRRRGRRRRRRSAAAAPASGRRRRRRSAAAAPASGRRRRRRRGVAAASRRRRDCRRRRNSGAGGPRPGRGQSARLDDQRRRRARARGAAGRAAPSGRGRGVDNRPAWMTRPDRPGAPPPRTGEPPKAYVEPPASAPTRRVREAAPAPTRGGPMSIQGFIKATGHAAPGDAGGAPEPKRAKRNGRRGAADFFD